MTDRKPRRAHAHGDPDDPCDGECMAEYDDSLKLRQERQTCYRPSCAAWLDAAGQLWVRLADGDIVQVDDTDSAYECEVPEHWRALQLTEHQ